jgi:cob(I)alamin adenosyltransferase
MRAAGAGLRVFIAQFAKGQDYSELHSLARLSDLVTVRQYGTPNFIAAPGHPRDIALARQGLAECCQAIVGAAYDVIILDEVNLVVTLGLIDTDQLLELIRAKPEHVELVITGRGADPRVLEAADLVTEMREIKHYYRAGVMARVGIEN